MTFAFLIILLTTVLMVCFVIWFGVFSLLCFFSKFIPLVSVGDEMGEHLNVDGLSQAVPCSLGCC